MPRDDSPADEDLIRRVKAHHNADGNDHLERIIFVPPVTAADFENRSEPLQQSSAIIASQNHIIVISGSVTAGSFL